MKLFMRLLIRLKCLLDYREKHVKMMQDRITQVENQFGELCQIFGSLERKLSKMRDTGKILSILC